MIKERSRGQGRENEGGTIITTDKEQKQKQKARISMGKRTKLVEEKEEECLVKRGKLINNGGYYFR